MVEHWHKISQLKNELRGLGIQITQLQTRQTDVARELEATYEDLAEAVTFKFIEVTHGKADSETQS